MRQYHDRCRWSAFALVALLSGAACDSSSRTPVAPTPAPVATIAIVNLTATAERLTTTSQPGLLYRLVYEVRETGGQTGAMLVSQRFELSNGYVTEGGFNGTPRVDAGRTVPIQSSLSIYPASIAASHVTFSITYTDDNGRAGTAEANAAISFIE
jgi:hypothetical protein